MTGKPARPLKLRKTVAHVWRLACAERIASIWLIALAAALSYASSSHGADAARGRALYENHCQHCHTPKIHSRAKKLPLSKDELRLIVDDWRRQVNLAWTPEETADVVEYLNQTRYRFAPQ
jgi:mono/diheme cytochrome c family protein